ncbi:acetate/propionate family kinase [Ligilactobacillus pobuzihii]|uniref:Acetate kinase n=1 Tax=Ligilactobacillus pobuzihii TaxID=449659 RepID=A0A0R2LAV5_9LACO|nr:acetate kinase [Ligilactobacillus pobuzihii]KRK10390.1 acetate kinase [Ligilactobacillus pobuzihii E100301 = KCTC 13174]KRN98593.1 acetate kinase [Ligilactobacillus pobuzihii]GEN47607.1 acetate kinase [Ligilactobacillus pobuzihii]
MEKLLVINSGSSSLKFKLFVMPEEKEVADGLVDRIGIAGSKIKIKYGDGQKYENEEEIKDHEVAVDRLTFLLKDLGIVKELNEITAVGHRVVAGGEYFKHSVVVDDEVIKHIDEIADMAPLHNPANLMGIKAFKEILPDAFSVASFDTAFHQTMPAVNYLYSTPYEWYKDYSVRRYGAHGISHKYVSQLAAEKLGKPVEDLKLITCHLGAGSSVCAVKNGKSFDVSMGFTPLTGVTMATRSGDVDAALLGYMMDKLNIDSMDEMLDILNHKSGLIGISGVSSDMRDLLEAEGQGNKRAGLAIDMFVKNVVKYIGEYIAEMGGVDGIVFTAGIGENSIPVRKRIMDRLDYLGLTYDDSKNSENYEGVISQPDSKVAVLRLSTNEELMIARDIMKLKKEA